MEASQLSLLCVHWNRFVLYPLQLGIVVLFGVFFGPSHSSRSCRPAADGGVQKANARPDAAARVRYSALDLWRGVGVFVVVLGHATTVAHFGMGDAPMMSWAFRQTVGAVGTRMMEFFFLASGFLICRIFIRLEQVERCWLAYLRNRVKRIIPPFTAYLLAIWLLNAFGAEFAPVLSSVPGGMWWVVSFTTNWLVISQQSWGIGALIVHFWSLAVEEQLCVLAPVLYLALRRHPRLMGRCVLAATVLIPLGAILHGCLTGVDRFIFINTFMQLDVFALGMWLAMLPTPPSPRRISPMAWAALSVPLLASVTIVLCRSDSMTMHIASIISGKLCGVLWFVLVSRAVAVGEYRSTALLSRFFELLGRKIYGVYVWHKLVLAVTLWIVDRLFVDSRKIEGSFPLFLLFALAGLLLSLGLSQVGWILVRPLLYSSKASEGRAV
jgi:peptidoglycan/LPS O-acetylase OafA/YrhL